MTPKGFNKAIFYHVGAKPSYFVRVFFKKAELQKQIGFHPLPKPPGERYPPGRVQLKLKNVKNRLYLNQGRHSVGAEPGSGEYLQRTTCLSVRWISGDVNKACNKPLAHRWA